MKNEKLLRSIGEIDDKYIKEAAPQADVSGHAKKIRRFRLLSVAACMAVFILAATGFAANYVQESLNAFYLRWLTPDQMAIADSIAEEKGAKVYFDGLKTSDWYTQLFAINKLVEYYNDEDIREDAIRAITPFLKSEDEQITDAAAFALAVLTQAFDDERIFHLADGSMIFATFNGYSDYGTYNRLWRIRNDVLEQYFGFPYPQMYIRDMVLSPDKNLLAVHTISNKSSYVTIFDPIEGYVSSELIHSARNLIAKDLGHAIWQRIDFENYCDIAGADGEYILDYSSERYFRWLDNETFEFGAILLGDLIGSEAYSEFHVTAAVRYNFRTKSMEYDILKDNFSPLPAPDDSPGHIAEPQDMNGNIFNYGGNLSIDHFKASEYKSNEPVSQFMLNEDKAFVFTGSGYDEILSMRIEGAVHHGLHEPDQYAFSINGLYAIHDNRFILLEDYRDEDYWREDGVAEPVCVYDGNWIWVEIQMRQSYQTFVLYNVATNETKDLLCELGVAEPFPSRRFAAFLMDNGRKLAVTDDIVSLLAIVDVESEKISYLPGPHTQDEGYISWSGKADESVFYLWEEEIKSGKLRILSIHVYSETVTELLEVDSGGILGYIEGLGSGEKMYFVDYHGNFRYLKDYADPVFRRFSRRLFFSGCALLIYDDLITLIDYHGNAWYVLEAESYNFAAETGFHSWVEGDRLFICALLPDNKSLTTVFDFTLSGNQ